MSDFPVAHHVFMAGDIGEFTIDAEIHEYYASFRIYKCSGSNIDGSGLCYCVGRDLSDGTTEDYREADLFFNANIKWDGCIDFWFNLPFSNCSVHFCGRDETAKFGDLLVRLYGIAAEFIPRYDRETVE